MGRRFSLLLVTVILVQLACIAPIIGNINVPGDVTEVSPSRPSALGDVAISPTSGSGSFTVTVSYFWRLGDPDFSITCTYPDSNGNNSSLIPITHEKKEYVFTINVTTPGNYSINCQDSKYTSAAAPFTVTGTATEATKTTEFTHATITFNGDLIRYDTPPLGGPTGAWLEGYCWPPQDNFNNGKSYFTVAADGRLEGKCSGDTPGVAIQGSLVGQYYKENSDVEFILSASNTWTPIGDEANGRVSYVVLSGTAKLIGDAASDTAKFKVTCNAHGNNTCYHDTDFQDLEYTGTIPFTITFLP